MIFGELSSPLPYCKNEMSIARGIAKTNEFPDSIFMQSICDCTDPEHGHSIVVEFDPEESADIITCSIYQTLEWAQYRRTNEPPFIVRIWNRLKNATKYLFTGVVKVEGHHLFSEESARDYANALLGAADELRRKRNLPPVQPPTGN